MFDEKAVLSKIGFIKMKFDENIDISKEMFIKKTTFQKQV